MNSSDKKIRQAMIRELNVNGNAYDDCGEINCTQLAENIADALDLYEDDAECTIPERVFEIAFEASEWFKNQKIVDEDDESEAA